MTTEQAEAASIATQYCASQVFVTGGLTLSSDCLGLYGRPFCAPASCQGAVAACITALAPSLVGACRFLMNQRMGPGRRELA